MPFFIQKKMYTKGRVRWRCCFNVQIKGIIHKWERIFESRNEAESFALENEPSFYSDPTDFIHKFPSRKHSKKNPIGDSVNARLGRIEETLKIILSKLND
jgi:hypothetical protein